MKTLIYLLILLLPVYATAQEKRDTTKKSLSDSLGNSEIIILNQNSQNSFREQDNITILRDSSVTGNQREERNIEIHIDNMFNYKKQNGSTEHRSFRGHWCGFGYGFVNWAKSDYSLYPASEGEFMELDWSRSFAMQFNVYQHSINLVPRQNLGLVVGVGLEYQRLIFEKRRTSIALNDDGIIVPKDIDYNSIKRNSFKNLFLTIPVLLEVQFPTRHYKKMYLSGGVVGGLRLHSKTKIVYNNENGKKRKSKDKDSFNQIPFKADVMGKIGYRNINIWASYTLTPMFKSDKGPELHPYTIGIGITI